MSAEGVEPVAWAVIDKDGAFWDAAPLSSKEYADKRAAVLNRTRDGYPTPYTVVPLYAHPAATAREEAWKAMVEALTYIASHRGLTLLGDGSYSDGVRDGWIELADAADRALALARSTGGEHA